MTEEVSNKPIVITVVDVQETEDGGATYSFHLDENAKDKLADIGLEFVLHCAAHKVDMQEVLDNIKKES